MVRAQTVHPDNFVLVGMSPIDLALPCGTGRMEQGWTAPAKPTGMTPWSRHGQRPGQGSPGILLFELVLCITLPGVGPGKIHHC